MLKEIRRIALWVLTFLGLSMGAEASHLVGGYLSYEYLGRNAAGNVRYKISLFIFRDCLNSTIPFTDNINVGVYHVQTDNRYKIIPIPMIGRPQRVQPPGFTRCNFYSNNVCIERAVYETVTELAPSQFGYHVLYSICCRNIQVNLTNSNDGQANQGQTYYAKIPPTDLENSSPVFRTIPSPFICVNDTTDILYSAVDRDGDSLAYRIMHPYSNNSAPGVTWDPPTVMTNPLDNVRYKPGYSQVHPFGLDGYLAVEPRTGLTSLFSRRMGNFVVGIEVTEYRNGEQIGSPIRLDLQILVLQCPPNTRPEVRSLQGYEYEVEAGNEICFDIEGIDADNDNLLIEGVGEIFDGSNGYKGPRATFSNSTGRGVVSSRFCWKPGCDQVADLPYLFTIMLVDDGCPSKFDNKNFSIKVKPFEGSLAIDGPDRVCQGGEGYIYRARDPKVGSGFEWLVQNGVILSADGPEIRVRWTSPGTGIITMTEISPAGCRGEQVEKFVTIEPNPPLPVISGKDTICEHEVLELRTSSTSTNTMFWEASGNPVLIQGNRESSFQWPVGVLGNFVVKHWVINPTGCVSDTAIFEVNVRKPQPQLSGPLSVCPNSRGIEYLGLNVLSGSQLNWVITGGTFTQQGNRSILVDWGNEGAGTVELRETDRFGCVSDVVSIQVLKSYNLQGEPIQGPVDVCAFDENVPYFVTPSAGSAYRWGVAGGQQQTGDSSPSITVNWGVDGAAQVYYVQVAYDAVNDRWCFSDTIRHNVTIHPMPNADVIQGSVEVCQFVGPQLYRLNGFQASFYHWTLNGDSSNIQGQGTSQIEVFWNTPGNFLLRVQEISNQGCPGTFVDTLIVVHPKPTADIIEGNQIFCSTPSTNERYTISGFNNSQYNWWVLNGSLETGGNSEQIEVLWNGENPAWVKVLETSEFGCPGDTLWYTIYFDKLAIDLKAVSVGTPDNQMHLFWSIPEDVVFTGTFAIESRREDETTFTEIGQAQSWERYYLQKPVNTDVAPLVYRISAENMCGDQILSEEHTHIRVEATRMEDSYGVQVNFSPYLGWDNGASYYEIYMKNGEDPSYQLISTQTDNLTLAINNGADQFRQCFRVLGYENGGKNMSSWSNEVCLVFSPSVYVPNAFSPNNDLLNDGFNIVGGAVKDFYIAIYDRWGTKLIESDQMDLNWDGTYLGEPVPAGVYMYNIIFTDHADRAYDRAGTIHLIR